MLTSTGSYTSPLGDNTGVREYAPLTINMLSGTFAAGAYEGAKVVDAKYPAVASADYISRYWDVTTNGITNPVYTVNATYADGDVTGNEANLTTVQYAGIGRG